MQIKMAGRTESYSGAVEIDFQANENVTVHLTDGRAVDLFADGTWQTWTPPATDPETGARHAPELLGQGAFHSLAPTATPEG